MADLTCYITTFNCGRDLINVSYFARHLLDGVANDSTASTLPPDLMVLCLQEIAPISYSFLGGSFLSPYFNRFSQAIQEATRSRFDDTASYETVLVRNLGMTAIMIFAKADVAQRIRGIETGGVGCGMWDMGNKGAVGARFGVDGEVGQEGERTSLTFVAAHLAPMEEDYNQRNQDWKAINEGLMFRRTTAKSKLQNAKPASVTIAETESEPLLSSATDGGDFVDRSQTSGMFTAGSHLFFAGDLNYRTSDQKPGPNDYQNWPQPIKQTSDPQHYSQLLKNDQLSRELKNKKTLHHLTEAPIDFPPTYKYSSAAQKVAAQRAEAVSSNANNSDASPVKGDDDDDQVWLWAKHRVPSWCDRILYLPQSSPKIHSYMALPLQPTSDHRPVILSFSIPEAAPKAGDALAVQPPFAIKAGWEQRRRVARVLEVVVGLGAYLALTWEGRALFLGTIVGILGGAVMVRALLGY